METKAKRKNQAMDSASRLHGGMRRFHRQIVFVAPILLALFITACGRPYEFNGTQYPSPVPADDFAGTNWDGAAFHMSDLQGNVVLLFFGYTFCPDICPLTLAEMSRLSSMLGEDAASVRTVFVSVDPQRDTLERLAVYVPAFNPAFYGVHVSDADLDTIKQAYGVFVEKREIGEESSIDYLIDHTGWIYVIDQDGNLRLAYGHDDPAEEMEPDIRYLLSE